MKTSFLLLLVMFCSGHVLVFCRRYESCEFNATGNDEVQTLTSPRSMYPDYPDCRWILKAPDGFRVELRMESFNVIIKTDYLKIYEDESSYLELRGSSTMPQTFYSFNSILELRNPSDIYYIVDNFKATFKSISASVNCGFNSTANNEAQDLSSPGWPEPYGDDLFCLWTLTARRGYEVKFRLQFLDISDTKDSLTIFHGKSTTRLTRPLSNPRVYYSRYEALVIRFSTVKNTARRNGFNGLFTEIAVNCTFNATARDEAQAITSPEWPDPYPQNQRCRWILSAPDGFQVKLTFESIDTLYADPVKIFEAADSEVKLPGDTTLPQIFHSVNGRLEVFFAPERDNRIHQRKGFKATFTKIAVNCGFNSTANDEAQDLSSPGWPEPYGDDLFCLWTVTARRGYNVKFRLQFLNISDTKDSLTIFHRKITTRLTRPFSNPQVYYSTNEVLVIPFSTVNNTARRNGFNGSFTEMNLNCTFNATARDEAQAITSPGWPDPYPPNQECQWILKAPDEFQVKLTFESFNTDGSDPVKIFEAADFEVKLRGRSITLPQTFYSVNGRLEVLFTSGDRNRRYQRKGFKATFTKIAVNCGFNSTANNEAQDLSSPGLPEPYGDDLFCLWTLTARRGYNVKFRLQFLNISDTKDSLTIFHGKITRRLTRSFSYPQTYYSTNEVLVIRFSTVKNMARKNGFNGSFTETNCKYST